MRSLSLLLAGAIVGGCRAGDFLHHLPRIDPGKIARQSPSQVAQTVAKTAGDAAKSAGDLASSPQSAANAGKQALAEGKDAIDGARPQDHISKALDAASDALKHASDRVSAANASDVRSALTHAGDAALPQDTSVNDLVNAAHGASKDDIANSIRDVTPSITGMVDRTGQRLAHGVDSAVPKATGFVNRTGGRISSALGGVPYHPSVPSSAEETEDEEGGSTKMMGLLLLAIAAGGGYFVAQRFKQSNARSPILLSDALDDVRGDSPQSRGGVMQMTAVDEPAFSRF